MTIQTRISLKEYSKLLFGLTYKKPLLKIILSVALLLAIWIAVYYSHLLPVSKPAIYQYITLILILLIQPLAIYLTIRRNYYSSNHLREPVNVELTKLAIEITGESFFTRISWEKLHKIDEQDAWFLLYQNNLSAILIPKKEFDENQLEQFYAILQTVHNVPKNLLAK